MNKIQVKKTASALYLCTVMLLANAAQAGWLADFLCGGDNDPRVCRTHLPDWALRAGQPSKNDKTDALLQEAKQLNGDAKKNFLNQNRKILIVRPGIGDSVRPSIGDGNVGARYTPPRIEPDKHTLEKLPEVE